MVAHRTAMARNQSDELYGNTDSTRCAVVRARTAAHSEKRSACRVSIGVVWSRRMNFVCSRRMVNSKRRGLTAPQSFHVQRPVFSASLCPPRVSRHPLPLPPSLLDLLLSSRFPPPSRLSVPASSLPPSALSFSLSPSPFAFPAGPHGDAANGDGGGGGGDGGGGCCGVACVCKSCVRGCGTAASREYACAPRACDTRAVTRVHVEHRCITPPAGEGARRGSALFPRSVAGRLHTDATDPPAPSPPAGLYWKSFFFLAGLRVTRAETGMGDSIGIDRCIPVCAKRGLPAELCFIISVANYECMK